MPDELNRKYRQLKILALADLGSQAVADLLAEMANHARELLSRCEKQDLISRVANKRYFAYSAIKGSRPINQDLYIVDEAEFGRSLIVFKSGIDSLDAASISRIAYTVASSVFAANDAFEVGRKATATFFEILIGHLVSRKIGVSPRIRVRMPETQANLPTDFVFDLGAGHRKIHLPIKTSTRERAVQAWVHQLVLDKIFGTGAYRGILVVSAETKRNAKTGEVIEICVPGQLQMFQARVAEISRVYYLDPPVAYLRLVDSSPRIEVRTFGALFTELPELLRS